MNRPYIVAGMNMLDPDFARWVGVNKLDLCRRLDALDDELTQWRGEFYRQDAEGRFVVENGGAVVLKSTVFTTPARPEWVAA